MIGWLHHEGVAAGTPREIVAGDELRSASLCILRGSRLRRVILRISPSATPTRNPASDTITVRRGLEFIADGGYRCDPCSRHGSQGIGSTIDLTAVPSGMMNIVWTPSTSAPVIPFRDFATTCDAADDPPHRAWRRQLLDRQPAGPPSAFPNL